MAGEAELRRRIDELEHKLAHAEQARRDDLLHAQALQRALLAPLPAPGRLTFTAHYLPADPVGGDLYDVHVAPRFTRVLLADATGHGVEAALRTTIVKTLYDRHKRDAPAPEDALFLLNQELLALHPRGESRLTACCFDVAVDGELARVRCASAAHPPLWLIRGGRAEELALQGGFLGLLPGQFYPAAEIELEPGDRLIAYTDGLVDRWDAAGERIAEAALQACLAAPEPLAACVDRALALAAELSGGRPAEDDVAVLGVEFA
jgi:sigma-B regulation protein RsbU (phosphoserine phosphatase)